MSLYLAIVGIVGLIVSSDSHPQIVQSFVFTSTLYATNNQHKINGSGPGETEAFVRISEIALLTMLADPG